MSLGDALGLLVSSGKGGVGKSIISIGLADELAQRGPTAMLDLDTRSPNLPYLLGMSRDVRIDAAGNPFPKVHDFRGHAVPVYSNGFLAEDGVPVTMPGEEVRSAIAGAVVAVRWPDGIRWAVLDVDPAPGDSIAASVQWFRRLAAFVVTASDLSSVQDCDRMISALREAGVSVLGVVGNMIRGTCPHCGAAIAYGEEGPASDLARRRGVRYVGSLPWHPDFRNRPLWAVENLGGAVFRDMADLVEEAERRWNRSGGA